MAEVATLDTIETPELTTSPEVEEEAVEQAEVETEEWQAPSQEEYEAALKDAEARARKSEQDKAADHEKRVLDERETAQFQGLLGQYHAAAAQGIADGLSDIVQDVVNWTRDQLEAGSEIPKAGLRASEASIEDFKNRLLRPARAGVLEEHTRATGKALIERFGRPEVSTETLEKVRKARSSGRMDDIVAADLDLFTEIITKQLSPKLRAEVVAELKTESKAREAEAGTKARGQNAPTAVSGGSSARRFKTQLEVDTALARGEIDLDEVRRQMARNLPYS